MSDKGECHETWKFAEAMQYQRDQAVFQRDEALAEARAHHTLWREAERAGAEADKELGEVRAQRDALRETLRKLARRPDPLYDTDDCHEHADMAEAVIRDMRDEAREALAAVKEEA